MVENIANPLFDWKRRQSLDTTEPDLRGVLLPLLRLFPEQRIYECFFYYQLLAELVEAADLMDIESFGRLGDELAPLLAGGFMSNPDLAPNDRSVTWILQPPNNYGSRYHVLARLFAFQACYATDFDKVTSIREVFARPFGPSEWYDSLAFVFHSRLMSGRHLARVFSYEDGWVRRPPIGFDWERTDDVRDGTVIIDTDRPESANPLANQPSTVSAIHVDGVWLRRPKSVLRRGGAYSGNALNAARLWRLADAELVLRILTRFRQGRQNWRRLAMWFAALDQGNEALFDVDPLPNTSAPLASPAFADAWARIVCEIRPGDFLMVRDTRDKISSFIADLDGGSWSHAVRPLGDGEIMEIDYPLIRRMPLDFYADAAMRMALFRVEDRHSGKEWLDFMHVNGFRRLLLMEGQPYDLRGAMRAGWRSCWSASPADTTPNALVRTGLLRPLVVA